MQGGAALFCLQNPSKHNRMSSLPRGFPVCPGSYHTRSVQCMRSQSKYCLSALTSAGQWQVVEPPRSLAEAGATLRHKRAHTLLAPLPPSQ